jgi:hypothetical protein
MRLHPPLQLLGTILLGSEDHEESKGAGTPGLVPREEVSKQEQQSAIVQNPPYIHSATAPLRGRVRQMGGAFHK